MRKFSGESSQDVSKRDVRQTRRANSLPTTGRKVRDTQNHQGDIGRTRLKSQEVKSQKPKAKREVDNFTKPKKDSGWSFGKWDQPKQLKEMGGAFLDNQKRIGKAGLGGLKFGAETLGNPGEWPGQALETFQKPAFDYDADGFDADYSVIGEKFLSALGMATPAGRIGSTQLGKGVDGIAPMASRSARAAKRIQMKPLQPRPVRAQADDALEHPGLAPLQGDEMTDDDLIEALGLFPDGVNRQASGLADPRLHTGRPGNFQKLGPRGPRNSFNGSTVQKYIQPRNTTMRVNTDQSQEIPVDVYEALFDMNPYS